MKVLRFFVRQRVLKLERALWRRLACCLLQEMLAHGDYQLGVHFVGATEMARLNETFLGHQGSTDVITFNHQEKGDPRHLYGEIFISVDDAVIQARQFRACLPSELTRYLIHGVLHLEGFDDGSPASRRAMKRRENSLLKELSGRFDLGRLARLWH